MKLKVLVSGVVREINSNGKQHNFSEVWVHFPNMPFPVQVDHYGMIDLAPGEYDVPVIFDVRNRRINIQFNFRQAISVKAG